MGSDSSNKSGRSDDSKFLNHVSHCCFQTSFRETARLFCLRTSKRSFELAFQCHQFEVNHHPVADVRPVLLKSGQSSLRGEAVEEMKDCRSMLQHWCRSKVMPEYGDHLSGQTRFYKRVKRIHDHVKIVVPCAVFEAESPIPPNRSVHLDSYNGILDDHQHIEASHRRLRFRDEIDKDPAEAILIDTDRIPSNDTNKPASIDAITSPSIDTGHISEQKEFDVCGNLRDGDTTTRSDKSGGKKRRNWKRRKRIMGYSQLSLILFFLDGFRKSRVRSRCFSKSFAKVRALLIAKMIDRGEESMEEAFTQE
ncbi:hypothetical protein DY000_02039758 [Brassica cretica]|uniref:Uncharacterized protein n=1 Tax=Brassica cretica TaxID=69181 RepID=A0ABQ7BGW7_BRACR|nr:hypothetical protein DY000_02039758 [Brassica cretica]